MTLIEAIEHRHSVRTYRQEKPDGAVLDFVKQYISGLRPEFPGSTCTLALCEKSLEGKIGTYGVVKGAQCFIAVAYDPSDGMQAVNAGFVAERLVLELTARGMGTVWLGATFSVDDVLRSVSIPDSQKVAAVIPFGIPAEKESFTGKIFSLLVRSRSRKPFDEFFTIPAGSTCLRALELMRLAPSGINRQGWRAVQDSRGIHFFNADTSRYGMIDMGIGLSHFAVAAPSGAWKYVPDACSLKPGCDYVISYLFA